MSADSSKATGSHLRRSLTLWDLVLYGVIVIQPVAPLGVYGVLYERSRGHVVTTILLAMVAMLFTAVSYGRMAQVYPSAGSAFTYVSREIHPALGFATGWSMVLDYLLNPMICIIWCSQQMHVFVPEVPYVAWAVLLAILFTTVTAQGVKTSARYNEILVIAMCIAVALFLVVATRFFFAHESVSFATLLRPFYDRARWNTKAVLGGTSVAVLTYIGFDGISTLSEEVENPRRNILLATVLTCLVIGLLSAFEVYAAQLVWPASHPFLNIDTAFVQVAGYVWRPFFTIFGLTLLIANIGSGTGAHLGAARLLYGMGRSNALPPRFFAAVSPKNGIPRRNVLLIGAITLTGALLTDYAFGAELLNFGALIAFMGVNLAALLHFFVRNQQRTLLHLLMPSAGFVVCLLLWLNLSHKALLVGSLWLGAGILYGAWRTKGFRSELVTFDAA